MFQVFYPQVDLTRVRILRSGGEPRGLSITPQDRIPLEPPELGQRQSLIVPSADPGKVFVIEFGDRAVELHDVSLRF